ncbi:MULTISPECIES: PQQ-dependent sugar dehydrogenase [unclassified Microbacterium]|uniref:PQQ-dependent sugar dehydrogenase n=1 Tax=unclassified Microbacterium TaxID=2609290 RepID=UPI00109C9240|nr:MULTISPECIES: PQQ-dependent sugar dehydrogenase [unclassified Microbacterium]
MVIRSRRGLVAWIVLSAASIALVACAPTASAPSPSRLPDASGSVSAGTETTLVENLAAPWSIAFHEGVALISERDSARIVEVSDDGDVGEVAVIDGVAPGGEGGLLGIAVRDGYLYAYSTVAEENRVQRFRLAGSPGSLGLGAPETILDGLAAASNHNGGRIAFGPDGMLYVTVGDAGDRESAQDPASLSGKILRITPEGAVPGDNPIDGSPVYSLGHRNPQGLAWDETGTLYASEFGQDTWDELNVIEPGGNYGWPVVEGVADRAEFIDPVQQWAPDAASPSGIAIAEEAVFIANLRGERLREVPLNDLSSFAEHFIEAYGRLRDVVVAPDGALWMLTNNTDGRGEPGDGDDRVVRVSLDEGR